MDKPRVAWVDYAKGICIVAVVMMYVSNHVGRELGDSPLVLFLVKFAKPFRMPDFFLISGLFLSRVIDRPLRSYLDKKVVHFMYFFALWTTITFVVLAAQGLVPRTWDGRLEYYLTLYVEPYHQLWFIEMLPLYFVVTRVLRRVPVWLVLPLAATLQIANPSTGQVMLDRFGDRYIFFYVGYVFAPYFFRFAAWVLERRGMAAAALAVWAVVNGWLTQTEVAFLPGVNLMLGFAGAGAVITASCLLSRWHLTDWLRRMGQDSIVVFLSFYWPMELTLQAMLRFGWAGHRGMVMVAVMAIAIGVPMFLRWWVQGTAARHLYVRPEWAKLREPRASVADGSLVPAA